MTSLHLPTAAEVDAARTHIAGIVRRTPLWRLDAEVPGTRIWLKLENLQPLGSFKLRAAVNAIRSADPQALKAGVLAPSAGNFGLGLAFAARSLGVPVTIVAPDSAAETKTAALQGLGARVVRVPFERWWQVMTTRRFEDVQGVFFHPVAEPAVIAGNATIGAEILEDLPEPDAILVPYGGGGLSSGIGSVMRRLKPDVRMFAVETEAGAPCAAALKAGGPVTVPYAPSFVDGIGSRSLLAEMWPIVRGLLAGSFAMPLAAIADAIRVLVERNRVVAEGAGAAPVAAALAGRAGSGRIVCVVSGGNIDRSKLARILAGELP